MATTDDAAFAPIRSGLNRAFTNSSAFSARRQSRAYESDEESEEFTNDWSLMPELKGYKEQGKNDRHKSRKLGVTWTDLTVKGVGADAAFNENVASQFNIPRAIQEARHGAPLKTILESSHGCVKPGEMLLVLGRPGSGCTTLLKMLANKRLGYADVSGDVKWGTLDHKQVEQYQGQIVMNTEDELFFPSLTVGQTMDFATR